MIKLRTKNPVFLKIKSSPNLLYFFFKYCLYIQFYNYNSINIIYISSLIYIYIWELLNKGKSKNNNLT